MKNHRVRLTLCTLALIAAAITAATVGAAALPHQDQIPPPQQTLAPHRSIEQLGREIDHLRAQRVLNRGQSRSLQVKLERASDGLAVGNPDAVLRPLNAFEHEVQALTGATVIGDKDALVLQGLTDRAIDSVRAVYLLPLVTPLIQACPAPEECEPLVLHVDQRARSGGDGSIDAPFRGIAEALAAATRAGACGVRIRLHAGTYRESVTLPLATWIDGGDDRPVIVGSLLNPAGHELHVSKVTFDGSPAPGAIVVDSPCGALTEVLEVVIRDAAHHGILQRRGALRVIGSDIRGTRPDPGDAGSGRAIRLTEGVDAAIGVTGMSFNVGGGLLASGEDTRVYLALSDVSFNELHPLPATTPARNGHGAVEVAHEALLLSEFTSLIGNQGTGILVRDGARAHFRYGRIERSEHVEIDGEGVFYGFNAAALDTGVLQLTHFRSNHADFVGLAFLGGYGRAANGWVAHNPIGIGAVDLPADFSVNELFACLQDNVRLLHNEINFDGDELPVPCDDELGEDCPVCTVEVPFVCTWCG